MSAIIDGSNASSLPADSTINGVTVGKGGGNNAYSTVVGSTALAATNTQDNAAFGYGALGVNTSGSANAAFGSYQPLGANTTGSDNSAFGREALWSNTTGGQNTSVGRGSLRSNTTSSNSVAIGYQALYTGSSNTDQCVAVGRGALYTNNAIYNTAVGDQAMRLNTTGANNSAFGLNAMYSNTTGGSNVAIGMSALQANTTASNNTAVGYQAMYANTTGTGTALGTYALKSNTTGTYNIAIGGNDGINNAALENNTTGGANIAIGGNALKSNTTGNYGVAVGLGALNSNTTTSNNTAVGYKAGYLSTGYANTFVGCNNSSNGAGSAMTTGTRNTILGGFDGNQYGLDIRTANGHIVLSDGDGNPRLYVTSDPYLVCAAVYNGTTASGANINVASSGFIARSTSALKYKQDIRDLPSIDINKFRPVVYKSKCEADDQTKDYFGFIADEVDSAGIKELVQYGADGEVEGFSYDRLTAVLVKAVQELKAEVDSLKQQLSTK